MKMEEQANLNSLTWDKCHGRKAKTIWFPATPDQQMQVNNIECELICMSEFKGDRDEIWICEVRNGVELARHNIRSIESIIWENTKTP